MTSPYIIGIAGASGSGKTAFANSLYDSLLAEGVSLLSFDDYYKDDLESVNVPQPLVQAADVPDAVDTELLKTHLENLSVGESIERPVYDFASGTRRAATVRVEAKQFLIVEGVYAFWRTDILSYFQTRVFIDLPLEECLARRSKRDRTLRGRADENIVRRFNESIIPAFKLYVLPSKVVADVVISGDADLDRSVQTVMDHVRSVLKQLS